MAVGGLLLAARCGEIPAGGCPNRAIDACIDTSCAALYRCTSSGWEMDRACPTRDASVIVDAADAGREASVRDAAIDAPPGANGGPGCGDLQEPDCPLGRVLACAEGSCCGCEDLFVCQGGGWLSWGTCADGGISSP